MKECLDCSTELQDGAYTCPKCGGQTLIQTFSTGDDFFRSFEKMTKATQLVNEAAELYQRNDLDGAARKCMEAIRINDQNAVAHSNLGLVLARQGKYREAVPLFERALTLNPNVEGIPEELAQARAKISSTESGCYIATAVFEGSDSEEVVVLRRFRDNVLLNSKAGAWFVKQYYRYSPNICMHLNDARTLRALIKHAILKPVVLIIRIARV